MLRSLNQKGGVPYPSNAELAGHHFGESRLDLASLALGKQ